MEIHFLNVDLEIESLENLQPLVDDLGEDVFILFNGKNGSGYSFVSFEIPTQSDRDIDGLVSSFCGLIENLSSEAKLIWDRCNSKRFDAGFESGSFPRSYRTELRADTYRESSQNRREHCHYNLSRRQKT